MCVGNIASLIKYYDIFKRLKDEGKHRLKIATIFSYGVNEDDLDATGNYMFEDPEIGAGVLDKTSPHTRDKLEEFIGDYNSIFNTKYTTKDQQSFYNYYNELSRRVKNKEIDLLLVVNMFLTGFDSPNLNTLFVDKNLRYHGLIQAYSRTGRKYTGIVIEEAPQDWILGVYEQTPVNFFVQPDSITVNGDSVLWGVVSKLTPATTVPNGKTTADLEYFLMGERGDQYRMINFPNVIRTKYLVDSAIQYNYIDINYYYSGHNEGVQKSEKTITLAVPKVGATNSVSNVLANNIISALATATGLTIAALDTSAS